MCAGYLAHGTATDYMYERLGVPLSFTWEIYGDTKAHFNDCFRMFNPVTQAQFDEARTAGRASPGLVGCPGAALLTALGMCLVSDGAGNVWHLLQSMLLGLAAILGTGCRGLRAPAAWFGSLAAGANKVFPRKCPRTVRAGGVQASMPYVH